MTLPEICPLDENQACKGKECHLFCLEWRTKEPVCLIGYSTTSKMGSSRASPYEDTYAEKTFRKLSKKSTTVPKMHNVSEKGDWIPKRDAEKPKISPIERKEEKPIYDPYSQKMPPGIPESENPREKLRERQASIEAEKASTRLETRLKKEAVEENPIIFAKINPDIQQSPKTPEKVVSKDKHTTIFAPFDAEQKKESHSPDREEKIKRENREKSKKLNEAKEIDLPDVYDEEFWS